MKNYKWWFKQSVVYGLAATGIGLMCNANDWDAARISWLFAGLSVVSLIVGAALRARAKSLARR